MLQVAVQTSFGEGVIADHYLAGTGGRRQACCGVGDITQHRDVGGGILGPDGADKGDAAVYADAERYPRPIGRVVARPLEQLLGRVDGLGLIVFPDVERQVHPDYLIADEPVDPGVTL